MRRISLPIAILLGALLTPLVIDAGHCRCREPRFVRHFHAGPDAPGEDEGCDAGYVYVEDAHHGQACDGNPHGQWQYVYSSPGYGYCNGNCWFQDRDLDPYEPEDSTYDYPTHHVESWMYENNF